MACLVVRGPAAVFNYWFNVFGHSGPYSQSVEVSADGTQKVITEGNPMNSPGKFVLVLKLFYLNVYIRAESVGDCRVW